MCGSIVAEDEDKDMKALIVAGVMLLAAGSVAFANTMSGIDGARLSDKEMAAVKASGQPAWAGVYAPNPYWVQNGCGVACKPADWGQYRSSH